MEHIKLFETFSTEVTSSIDKELVGFAKKMSGAVAKLQKDDWSYDPPFFYNVLDNAIHAIGGLDSWIAAKDEDITGPGYALLRAFNSLNITKIKTADDRKIMAARINAMSKETAEQIKKILPAYKKALAVFGENSAFKMAYILYSEFRYTGEREDAEAEFIEGVIRKHNLLADLDPYRKGVDIKIIDPIKSGGEETGSGNIVFFHANNSGKVEINGKVYDEKVSDHKKSHGWNYNN